VAILKDAKVAEGFDVSLFSTSNRSRRSSPPPIGGMKWIVFAVLC
jgi:hypothetical protein